MTKKTEGSSTEKSSFEALFAERPFISSKDRSEARSVSHSHTITTIISHSDIQEWLDKSSIIKFGTGRGLTNIETRCEVDLHGLIMEQACQALNDSVSRCGSGYLRVNHGKGDGILKSLAFQFAKDDVRVAEAMSVRDANGESGVMIYRLRVR